MDDLLETLKSKALKWKNMQRTTEEDRTKTEEYYNNNLMPLIKNIFVKKYKINSKCNGLILTLGTSYEPLVLSISALKPEKILILYTNETKKLLDTVQKFTKISLSQCTFEQVDSKNPLILYQKIKNIYEDWGQPENIYVDFTGGTKSMAAGCAMAGSLINATLIYVASKYDKGLRKAEPGSEQLILIDDPLKVFGDFERQEAINLFNQHDYVSASKTFYELNKRVPNTKEYEILYYLSESYNSWDNMNLKQSKKYMEQCLLLLRKECKLNTNYILYKNIDTLKQQYKILEILQKIHSDNNNLNDIFSNIEYMILNLYSNALRREEQKKYEIASLLLYRILEMIEQKRLWNYNINTSKPDYSVLEQSPYNLSKQILLIKINSIRNKIPELYPIGKLNPKISLLSGYLILEALNDSLMKENKISISKLIKNINIRNKSIFAHGYEFINNTKYNNFKNIVLEYLNSFFKVETINKDELFKYTQFIKL